MLLAGLIVKNEARDLPRCLRSIEPVIDGAVVVDTGSTDGTLEVAQNCIGKPVYTQTYLGASRQDEHGDWKLWDFAKARNVFVNECEKRGAERVFWMDADEELETPDELRHVLQEKADVFALRIRNDTFMHVNHRIWRTGLGIRFEGKIHEYLKVGRAKNAMDCPEVVIRHDATASGGETSNERNLRILADEWKVRPTPRTAYYYAQEYRHARDWSNAIKWYTKRIRLVDKFRDEWLMAHLHLARCQQMAGERNAAYATLLAALAEDRGWAEFWCELAMMALAEARYPQAIGFALQASGLPVPPSMLAHEVDMYGAVPARIMDTAQKALTKGDEEKIECSLST